MAQFLKPSNLNNVWASGGDRIYPGDTKYATGWQVEIPPRQYFNEIDYKQDQMLAHLNQHGIPVWDNETEYQADQSYVQGSTGTVYRCVLTHTNQNPDLDVSNTYWIIAFASAGDFYTATESDARYAKIANNGSDYNVATFRTNINVYSKAETYTKPEVDGKTTIASSSQARDLVSNTTLITPQRLRDAVNATSNLPIFAPRAWALFNGLNGNLRASGNIASITRTSPGIYTVTFTRPMSSINYAVIGSANQEVTSNGTAADTFSSINRTTDGFTATTFAGATLGDCAEISFLIMGD